MDARIVNTKGILYKNGMIVGEIVTEKKLLKKSVKGSIHMLRQPQGWTWDDAIITEAQKNGVETIRIFDQETGISYYSSMQHFMEKSFRIVRGYYAPQKVLLLYQWQTMNELQPSLF